MADIVGNTLVVSLRLIAAQPEAGTNLSTSCSCDDRLNRPEKNLGNLLTLKMTGGAENTDHVSISQVYDTIEMMLMTYEMGQSINQSTKTRNWLRWRESSSVRPSINDDSIISIGCI
jgi:hypothetical protein